MRHTAQAISMVALLAISATLSCDFALASKTEKPEQSVIFDAALEKKIRKILPGARCEITSVSLPLDPSVSPLKAIKAKYQRPDDPNSKFDYAALKVRWPGLAQLADSMTNKNSFDYQDFDSFFEHQILPRLKTKHFSDAEIARSRRFDKFWFQIYPLIEAQMSANGKTNDGREGLIEAPDRYKSDAEVDAWIIKVKARYPKAAHQIEGPPIKQNALIVVTQAAGISSPFDIESWLSLQGFKIVDRSDFTQDYFFADEAEASNYLNQHKIQRSTITNDLESMGPVDATFEWPESTELTAMFSGMLGGRSKAWQLISGLNGKSTVRQIASNKYQVNTPACIRVSIERHYYLIVKDDKGKTAAVPDPAALFIRMHNKFEERISNVLLVNLADG